MVPDLVGMARKYAKKETNKISEGHWSHTVSSHFNLLILQVRQL